MRQPAALAAATAAAAAGPETAAALVLRRQLLQHTAVRPQDENPARLASVVDLQIPIIAELVTLTWQEQQPSLDTNSLRSTIQDY